MNDLYDTILPYLTYVEEFLSNLYNNALPYLMCIGKNISYPLVGACAGAIGLPLFIAIVLPLLGFTISGIVEGTLAAMCMACHGGNTPRGGCVANMQSLGARGFEAGFNSVVFRLGAILGFIGGIVFLICNSKC